MAHEKITEGSNEFCKVVTTNVVMKSKATLEKEKKDLLKKIAVIEEATNNEMAEIDAQLAVFN